jgi:malic enzyme
VWPGCLIQFEDYKQQNALRLLDRYQGRIASFNDDVQGTAAVVLAGVLAGLRVTGRTLADTRVVLAGAGAAGIGIARLLRLAGVGTTVLVDSHGLCHAGRSDLDASKSKLSAAAVEGATPDLVETIRRVRPTVLVGTTGVAGTFGREVVEAMAAGLGDGDRPIVLPLSNPTSVVEATPADVLAWTDGRALVATGSPFDPVELHDGRRVEVGQANNAFVFPGVGLGTIVAEASTVTDRMFLLAGETLAAAVTDERLASGALYPPIGGLRDVSRRIAVAVAREAGTLDHPEAAVEAAMWWPAYVPYLPARPGERRRSAET